MKYNESAWDYPANDNTTHPLIASPSAPSGGDCAR